MCSHQSLFTKWHPSLMFFMCSLCSDYFSFVSLCVHLHVVDSWVGYEHSSFCGQQFVLERGEYPHWESWSGSNAYHIERMMSFRPICSAVRFCSPLYILSPFLLPELPLAENVLLLITAGSCNCNSLSNIIWNLPLFSVTEQGNDLWLLHLQSKNKTNSIVSRHVD